jgi:hypothetical protein
MNTSHRYFEVLCALAASGQLTQAEHAELRDHSCQCGLCRDRLAEMHQLRLHLFLAQARNTGSKKSPTAMRERFAARAVSEGIPLSPRSTGVGLSALGCVAVVLLALFLVAQTLKNVSSTQSVAETYHGESSPASVVPNKIVSPSQSASQNSSPVKTRMRRAINGTSRHERLFPVDLAALQNRKFLFIPYLRDPATGFPYRAPKLTFDSSSLGVPHFATAGFRGSVSPNALKANITGFNLDAAAFRSIGQDFPQVMLPEKRPQ